MVGNNLLMINTSTQERNSLRQNFKYSSSIIINIISVSLDKKLFFQVQINCTN